MSKKNNLKKTLSTSSSVPSRQSLMSPSVNIVPGGSNAKSKKSEMNVCKKCSKQINKCKC